MRSDLNDEAWQLDISINLNENENLSHDTILFLSKS